MLRRLTAVGLPLILLWSLSPLGGQASLRALEKFDQVTQSSKPLRYLLTGHTSVVLTPESGGTTKGDQIFISTLTASKEAKRAPRDNWGNVRVPQLKTLAEGQAAATAGPPPPPCCRRRMPRCPRRTRP